MKLRYYAFEYEAGHKTTSPCDEYGQRIGLYFRFKSIARCRDWVAKSKYRVFVPSNDSELRSLKFRDLIDEFTIEKD